MFSSFSAYLFGSSSANVEDDCEKENEFTTEETDGDWLIVDSCKQETRLSPEDDELHQHQPLKAYDNYNVNKNDKVLQSSSNTQKENIGLPAWLQHLRRPKMIEAQTTPAAPKATEPWLYDSWFITPPSCFNAGPAFLVHTSPLEDLLIEHPSMSVYEGINAGVEVNQTPKPTPQSFIEDVFAGDDNTNFCYIQARKAMEKREAADIERQAELLEIFKKMSGNQKIQVRQEAKFVHGKQMERHNKAQEFQSIGKRHRRKDFMKSPSGKSNNRKY